VRAGVSLLTSDAIAARHVVFEPSAAPAISDSSEGWDEDSGAALVTAGIRAPS